MRTRDTRTTERESMATLCIACSMKRTKFCTEVEEVRKKARLSMTGCDQSSQICPASNLRNKSTGLLLE
jgi:epoxyqueuosine reductase QueG